MGGELGTILEGTVANFNASQSDYEVIPSYRGSFTETVTGAIDAIRAGHNPTSFRFSKLVPPP